MYRCVHIMILVLIEEILAHSTLQKVKFQSVGYIESEGLLSYHFYCVCSHYALHV